MGATNNIEDLDLIFGLDLDSDSESPSITSTSDASQPQVPVNTPAMLTSTESSRPPSMRNGHTSDASDGSFVTADSHQQTPTSSEDGSIRGVPLPEGTESMPFDCHQDRDYSEDEESSSSCDSDDDSADEDYDLDFDLGSDEDDFFHFCLTDPEPEAEQAETLEAQKEKLYDKIAEKDGYHSEIIRGNRRPHQTGVQPTMQTEVSVAQNEISTIACATGSPRPEYLRSLTINVVSPFIDLLKLDIGHDVPFVGLKFQFLHAVDIGNDQIDNLDFKFGNLVLDHQCTPDDVGLKHMDTIVVEIGPASE